MKNKQNRIEVYEENGGTISAFYFTARGKLPRSAQLGACTRREIANVAREVASVLAGGNVNAWSSSTDYEIREGLRDLRLADAKCNGGATLILRKDADGDVFLGGNGGGASEEFFSALSRLRRGAEADYVAVVSPWTEGGSLCKANDAENKAVELENWLDEHPDATDDQKEQAQDAIRALRGATDDDIVDGDGWDVARNIDELAWLDPVED